MSFLENINIVKNLQDSNVTPEKAVDIYNNKDNLEFSNEFYFGNPDVYDEELKRIESNRLTTDAERYKGLGASLANVDLTPIARKNAPMIKAQEDALVKQYEQQQYEESWLLNRVWQQGKKSYYGMQISKLQKDIDSGNLTDDELYDANKKITEYKKQISEIPEEKSGYITTGSSILASGVEFLPWLVTGVVAGAATGGVGTTAITSGLIYKHAKDVMYLEAKNMIDEVNPNLDDVTKAEYVDTLTSALAIIEALGSTLGFSGLATKTLGGFVKQYGLKKTVEFVKNKSFKQVVLRLFSEQMLAATGETTEELLQASLIEKAKPIIEQGVDLTTVEALRESYIGLSETAQRLAKGEATEFDKQQVETAKYMLAVSPFISGAIQGSGAALQKINDVRTNQAKAQANLKKTQAYKKARDNNTLKAESPAADKAILKNIIEANKEEGYVYLNESIVRQLIEESPNNEVYANAVNKMNLVEALENSVDGNVQIDLETATEAIFDGDDALYQELENHITWSPDSMSKGMFDIYMDSLATQVTEADQKLIDEITAKLEPTSTSDQARADALTAFYLTDALSRADTRMTREQYLQELTNNLSVGDIQGVNNMIVNEVEKPQNIVQKAVRKVKKGVEKVKEVVSENKVDSIAKEYAKMLGQPISGFHNSFAQAIVNKDIDTLSELILSGRGMNEKSKKMFEKATGVKLPSTIKEKERTLVEWAGLNYDEYITEKQTAETERKERAEKEEQERRFNQYVQELEDAKVTFENETMSEKEMIDRLVNRGAKLSEKKVGVVNVYRLTESNGSYLEFKKKAQKEYIDSLFQASEEDLAHLFGEDKVEPQVGEPLKYKTNIERSNELIATNIQKQLNEINKMTDNYGFVGDGSDKAVAIDKILESVNWRDLIYSVLSKYDITNNELREWLYDDKNIETIISEIEDAKGSIIAGKNPFTDVIDLSEVYLRDYNTDEANAIKKYKEEGEEYLNVIPKNIEGIEKSILNGLKDTYEKNTNEQILDDFYQEKPENYTLFQKLYQRGFAGSRVDYDKPSLEAMGTGEGQQVHGWGLYYALSRDVAEVYRKKFIGDSTYFEYDGKKYGYDNFGKKTNMYSVLSMYHNTENIQDTVSYFEDNLKSKKENESYYKIKYGKDYYEDVLSEAENLLQLAKNLDESKIKKAGQVHEVELPENPYLLDEQLPFNEQPEIVKKALESIFNNVSDKYQNKNDVLRQYKKSNGRKLYLLVAEVAYFNKHGTLDGVAKLENRADKLASELLNKHGVKGITYEGRQDGRCFVIFNPKDVKVIQKFYQDLGNIQGEIDINTLAIKLSATRNPTTAAHEFFHYFSLKLENAYKDGVLKDYWLKRYRDAMKFAGAKYNKQTKEYYFESKEAWSKGQEKLANAFTEYLLEGRAPNKQLQSFFQIMKDWFKMVYDTIKNFPRVKLNKSITRVFDSIFAKEYEVETMLRAERLGSVEKPANVTDEQWQDYLDAKEAARGASTSASIKAANDLANKRGEQAYQQKKNEFFTQELAELQSQKYYQARDLVGTQKINRASIEGLTNDVKLNSKFLTKENTGLDARTVADTYGFNSITEMVEFINNTNDTKTIAEQIAEEKADAWVMEEYPELVNVNAENAVRNLALIKAQVYEAMMLQGIPLDRFNMNYNEMILSTEKIIQGMKMSEITNITRWQNRMNNLNEKLIVAQRKGDKKTAGKLRFRSAILNYIMLRSKNIINSKKKFDRKFDKYRYRPSPSQVKRVEGKIWDIINSVLYNFGFTQRKPIDTTNVAIRINNYIDDISSKNFTNLDGVRNQTGLLTNPEQLNINNVSVEDFDAINGSLRILESVSKRNLAYEQENKIREYDEDINDILEHYETNKINKWNKDDWGKNIILGHWGMKETLLSRILPENIFTKYVSPFMDGLVKATRFIREKGNEIAEIIKPVMKFKNREYVIDGQVFTYEQLAVIMANMGNEHNMKCMAETLNITEEELFSIADQSPIELREMAQKLWDMFEENSQQFKEVVERMRGVPLKMVEAKPITFSDGQTLRGGYYPANKKTNTEVKDYLEENSLKTDYTFPTFYFEKERSDAVHGDLDTTFKTLESWLYKMAMTINVAESYNNLSKITHSKRVVSVMGEGAKDELTNWMSQATMPEQVSKFVAIFDSLSSVAILGWNPIKLFTQMSGIIPAMKEVGVLPILSELLKTVINPINIFAAPWRARLSDYMNERYSNPEEHLADVRRMSWLDGGKTKKGLEWVSTVGMLAVNYGDAIAGQVTWKATYNKALSEGKSESEAVSLADSMVRRTQGDTSAGSRPPLLQGNLRFFNKFSSYFIGINSIVSADWNSNKKINAVAMLAVAGILAPMVEVLVSYAYEWNMADEDKKRKWYRKGIHNAEDFLQYKMKTQAISSVASSVVPAYGLGFRAAQYWNEGKVYPTELTSLTRAANLTTIPIDVYRGDYEKAFRKLLTGVTPIDKDEYEWLLEKLSRR